MELLKMIRTLAQCPLSADFVAPVAQLHPELASVYASAVRRPMDLSTIARRLRRAGGYTGAGKVYRDVTRMFRNCQKVCNGFITSDSQTVTLVLFQQHCIVLVDVQCDTIACLASVRCQACTTCA
jgi:Bromodomain